MLSFKYIIIDRVKYSLFAHGIEHIDEANGRNVTSAGFCDIGVENGKLFVRCYGGSSSLNIDSDAERDANIISKIAAHMAELHG
jgi:hypothetical protein